jgi:hypothetical protein
MWKTGGVDGRNPKKSAICNMDQKVHLNMAVCARPTHVLPMGNEASLDVVLDASKL